MEEKDTQRKPLRLRQRPDIQIESRWVGASKEHYLFDPIALEHYRLLDEEYFLWTQLNGLASLSQIREAFEKHYPGKRIALQKLVRLTEYFYHLGLVVSIYPEQGSSLLERLKSSEHSKLKRRWLQWWSFRWRGVNPNYVLQRMTDVLSPWLNAKVGMLALFLGIVTSIFAITRWTEVRERSVDLYSSLALESGLAFFIAFALLKVIHELAHGVACKYFGRDCHEMGLLFYFLIPSFYCNVSEVWLLSDRWQRCVVSAAGVVAEWCVATMAFWVWWGTNPGLIHNIAFFTMLVGSVNTLFVNGNPLMRFDGYFILSDLFDQPNLWSQSRASLAEWLSGLFVRNVQTRSPLHQSSKRFLIGYASLSVLYQCTAVILVLVGILMYLTATERDHWMAPFATLVFVSIGMVIQPSIQRTWKKMPRWRELRKGNIAFFLLLLGALFAGLFFWKTPYPLQTIALIRFAERTPVTVQEKGVLISVRSEGDSVSAGDVIAELSAPMLEIEYRKRVGELAQQRQRLIGLEARRTEDVRVAALIPSTMEAIEGLESEVSQLERRRDQLQIKAPQDGFILRSIESKNRKTPVPTSKLQPLDPENMGMTLQPGETLCQIAKRQKAEVVAIVSQYQVDLVKVGQVAWVTLKQDPGKRLQATVIDVASLEEAALPDELLFDLDIPLKAKEDGQVETVDPAYVLRASLEEEGGLTYANGIVKCEIEAAPLTMAARAYRWFFETLRFQSTESKLQPLP